MSKNLRRQLNQPKKGGPNESPAKKRKLKKPDDWLTKLTDKLERVQLTLKQATEAMRKQYNKNKQKTSSNGATTFAPEGTFVYLSTKDWPNVTTVSLHGKNQTGAVEPKWLPRYLGPFEVTEVTGGGNLNRKLMLPKTLLQRLKSNEFHVSKLKPLRDTEFGVDLGKDLPTPPVDENDDNYVIESLHGWQKIPNSKLRKFYIKWQGYEKMEWINEDMMDADETIAEYMSTNPTATTSTKKDARSKSTKRTTINVLISN